MMCGHMMGGMEMGMGMGMGCDSSSGSCNKLKHENKKVR